MVRVSQKLSVIGLVMALFVMGGVFTASADSALEVDYYGGYDSVGATMQGNLSSAYEVAAAEITRWINVLFNRAPHPGEVEGWVTGYFAYMVSLFIDVEYVMQELARQLFLSAEYAWVNEAEGMGLPGGATEAFVKDLYWAFLNRAPSPGELQAWMDGAENWGYDTALSAFWAADAVKARVDWLFPDTGDPDFSGLAPENLVAQFYLGMFNRLPTEDELVAAADLFDDMGMLPSEIRTNAGVLATTLLEGVEFDQGSKTATEILTALWRAFFNRFPATWEITYWVGSEGSPTYTPAELIEEFKMSAEFFTRAQALGLPLS